MSSKGRDFRGPRKRGFDDDDGPYFDAQRSNRAPRPQFPSGFTDAGSLPSEPGVDAVVKWFKPEKGFGFVELGNGTGDAFLHIGAVQAAGYDALPPGAKLKVNVSSSIKGQQVSRILEVDLASATERGPAPRGGGFDRPRRQSPDPATAVPVSGKVKWFNQTKGFGFVQSDDGGKDVFVHVSILGPSGIDHLAEGQPVVMQVVDTAKGREALSISVS